MQSPAKPGLASATGFKQQKKFRESTVLSPDYFKPPYVLQQEIGEGSFGKVYRASHKLDPTQLVAVKIIPIENRDTLDDLNKEIDILRKVGRSNFIVWYHGSYQTLDGFLWIVMDLCDLGSVHDILQMCQMELKETEICDIMAAAAMGLNHLHSQHLLHRDVKCANILLTKRGGVKLADFGISTQTHTQQKRHTTIGTPFWMAPEVIEDAKNQGYDEKCDLWSLGITLVEIAEGVPPLAHLHPMRAVFLIPTRAPAVLKNGLEKWSESMNDFLARCLVKDPKLRASAGELLLHPFIRQAALRLGASLEGNSETVAKLAGECAPLIAKYLKDKSLGVGEAILEEGEEVEEEGNKLLDRAGTLKLPPPSPSTPRTTAKQQKKAVTIAVMVVGALVALVVALAIGWWRYSLLPQRSQRFVY
ncbi:hypothetical protein BASA81_011115 [Batrachochytrium salamandrivorans]|nr:hypothetical protein BASA81_011115 [Batrachochytrium salamandrivorans]